MIWFHNNITFNWPRLALGLKSEVPQNQREDYIQNPKLILNPKRPAARIYTAQKTPGNFYIYVKVDPWKIIDIGVWGCQFRIDNTAIIHSVRLMGYPIPWDVNWNKNRDEKPDVEQDPERPGVYDTGYVFTPRPLLPKYFLPTVNHPLNTHLKIEESYTLVQGIQPVVKFYQDWKENRKSVYDESVRSSFEGQLTTNFEAANGIVIGDYARNIVNFGLQIWKNHVLNFATESTTDLLPWPLWLGERLVMFMPAIVADYLDFVLDMPRSLFSNIFSRKLPRWGNVNEKIKWQDLKKPTIANILALNAFAHHDMITLPLGASHTITTDISDVVDDITARIPYLGGYFNSVINGFMGVAFGSSPGGFKKGGVDERLKYYGDSMVGIMSKEFYYFYTGPYRSSKDNSAKGIIPFNAFQDQGGEPLSTMLNATSNSTGLNFKITDIIEGAVYDTSNHIPKMKRIDIVTTQHIAQFPGKKNGTPDNPKKRKLLGEEYEKEFPLWTETEVVLVDKYFNTLIPDTDARILQHFGEFVEDRRLYVVNEFCLQAIGAGDINITFFAQDPTVHNPQQVTIWEGKFSNFAKTMKSTRAWTTTIRFGQPNIQTIIQHKDEEGKVILEELLDATYRYPRTILADIQERPHLPPPPIEVPGEMTTYTLFTYSYEEWDIEKQEERPLKESMAETEWYWGVKKDKEPHKDRVPLIWKVTDEFKPYCYYKEWNLFKPLGEGKMLLRDSDATKTIKYASVDTALGALECIKGIKTNYETLDPLVKDNHTFTKLWFRPVRKTNPPMWSTYVYQSLDVYLQYFPEQKDTCPTNGSNIPSMNTLWPYWHAYYASSEKDLPKYDGILALWYSGLAHYKCIETGTWVKDEVKPEPRKYKYEWQKYYE